jgi:hypothetical protein
MRARTHFQTCSFNHALTPDQQFRLWKFDYPKWLVPQTTELIGFRGWLGVRDDFRNWLVHAA